MEIAFAFAEDFGGQQDLGVDEAQAGEGHVVFVHQEGLADGGAGLAEFEVGYGAFEFEGACAHADGSAGDQQDLAAFFAEPGNLAGDVADVVPVDAALLA